MEASRIHTAAPAAFAAGGLRQLVGDYVCLTKPKVQSLLLLTTITTMYVAGDPSLQLVFWTVLGGSLASGGAGAVCRGEAWVLRHSGSFLQPGVTFTSSVPSAS